MTQEPVQSTATVSVHTSAQSQRMPPPWLSEAVLLLQVARDSALLSQMQQQVRVPRGRMGTFEVCDFFLVLLVYAVSGELTLLALYAALAPSVAVVAALWSRQHLPARGTLSRFLKAVTQPAVETLRQLLFEDLLVHGLSGEQAGGLVDRVGARHVVFDVDGTRQVARQRQVVTDAQHPLVRRRLDRLCARGYPGRKRGDLVRTRSTVQQAHTSEWLGTFGAAGNGDAFADLERACQGIARYLGVRKLCPQQGFVRLDGLYGYAGQAHRIQHHGLGYLMRTADYRLLQTAEVQQALARSALGSFAQPDTGTVREVFEVEALDWASADQQFQVRCRLIITRQPIPPQRAPRVGKRQGAWVFELFVTDRQAPGLSALDLLSLYFARGGFEQTLAQEDREQDPDRWCSGHPEGQECWQLLSQWVWNVRLRLGRAAAAAPPRRTLWAPVQSTAEAPSHPAADTSPDPASAPVPSPQQEAPAAPPGVVPPPAEPSAQGPAPDPAPPVPASPTPPGASPAPSESGPTSAASPPGQVASAAGRGCGRFAGADFTWTEQQQLRCPAGKLLRPRQRTVVAERLQIRYQAKCSDCATCPLATSCRGSDAAAKRGRLVTVWAPVPAAQDRCADGLCPPQQTDPAPPSKPISAAQPIPAVPSQGKPAPGPNPPGQPPLLGPQPVWWEDVPATALRRLTHLGPYCQRIEIPPAPPMIATPQLGTRARRAHRRLNWEQRLARNAHPVRTGSWQISLFGIVAGIATYLASLRPSPC